MPARGEMRGCWSASLTRVLGEQPQALLLGAHREVREVRRRRRPFDPAQPVDVRLLQPPPAIQRLPHPLPRVGVMQRRGAMRGDSRHVIIRYIAKERINELERKLNWSEIKRREKIVLEKYASSKQTCQDTATVEVNMTGAVVNTSSGLQSTR